MKYIYIGSCVLFTLTLIIMMLFESGYLPVFFILAIGISVLISFIIPKEMTAYISGKNYVITRISLLLFILGLWFLLTGVEYIVRMKDANKWIQTPCTIIKSERRVTGHDDEGNRDYYGYYIVYSYKVNNIEYKSDRYTENSFPFVPSLAPDNEADFAAGKNTDCYVNPSNPKKAIMLKPYLDTESTIYYCVLFILSVSMFVACGIHFSQANSEVSLDNV
ncbi:MAG: DUF3592 domain-containing protein [Candidatus Eremiobacterota bacterium]